MQRTFVFALLLTSCATVSAERGTSSVDEATLGVHNVELGDLLDRHWEDYLRRDPVTATRLGDHRYDDRVGDNSLAALEDERKMKRQFLIDAQAFEKAALDPIDRITLTLFIEDLQASIAGEVCAFEEWNIDPRSSQLGFWNDLSELHPVKTEQDAKNLIARYRAAPKIIDNEIESLARGAKKGLYGNTESTTRAVTMLKTQLAQPLDSWPMFAPATKKYEGWSPDQQGTFSRELHAVIEGSVKPALERYVAFIERDLLPNARSDEHPGLAPLPFAKECYKARVAAFTTIDITPEALHQKGEEEIARINGEMRKLGQKLFGTDDLPKILEKLRTDPQLYFASAEEVEAKAKSALAAAKTKIPEYFGILPKADCVVSRIPDYEAPFTTIAYYREPVPDGSRPGQYFINIYQPTTRPKYEAEALAFHESIPGHHLQIAIAQELPALPAFRKYGGRTVFIEGWALYAEQLANEMGLYSADLDRMGMLSFESWRAARLVVDTGLHAMGWSRSAAKDYMAAHTALALNNIDNEVDRYINWPGQAVAYKTGQMEIWRLRKKAEAELGARFDLKAFHDVVLKNGAVSLPILGAQVEAWIQSANAQSANAQSKR